MSDFKLQVEVSTNHRTGEVVAAYFRIRGGRSSRVEELANGAAFADYDKHGRLIGIEFLEPCRLSVVNQIAMDESEKRPIKKFIKESGPRSLILA